MGLNLISFFPSKSIYIGKWLRCKCRKCNWFIVLWWLSFTKLSPSWNWIEQKVNKVHFVPRSSKWYRMIIIMIRLTRSRSCAKQQKDTTAVSWLTSCNYIGDFCAHLVIIALHPIARSHFFYKILSLSSFILLLIRFAVFSTDKNNLCWSYFFVCYLT